MLAAAEAAGAPPPLLRAPKRGAEGCRSVTRMPDIFDVQPQPDIFDGAGAGAGPSAAYSSSMVQTAARLGELHAELEAGHACVQAAIAGEAPPV